MNRKWLVSISIGLLAVALVACALPAADTGQTAATAAQGTEVVTEAPAAEVVATEEVAAEEVGAEEFVGEEVVAEEAVTVEVVAAEIVAEEVASSAALPEGATMISLGDAIGITGAGVEASDQGVHIRQGGVYVLQGTLVDGIVEVTAPDEEVTLILNGVSITNSDGPAIVFYASSASHVTLAEGTVNTLVDGGEHDEYDATLWSSATLTVDGAGELHVTGNYQEGIASEMHINIDGGSIWVTSFDDGLNANNDGVSVITINGGYLFVNSAGDGLDSNGTIVFNGGTTLAMSALTDMSGGIDADGAVTINGGIVIATGARNSTPVSASTQKTLVVGYASTQAAETIAALVDPVGDSLLVFAPAVAYQQLLFSSPQVAEGVTYSVYSGGSVEGEAVDGWYSEGMCTPGTQVSTVDTTSVTSQGFGPGGQGGPGGTRP